VAEAVVRLALSRDWKWRSEGWRVGISNILDAHGLRSNNPPLGSLGQPCKWIEPQKFRHKSSHRLLAGAGMDGGTGRNADIYVFAFHPREDDEADHLTLRSAVLCGAHWRSSGAKIALPERPKKARIPSRVGRIIGANRHSAR